MAGLVEILDVASDTHESMVHVIKILQGWHRRVSHYRTGVDFDGKPYLILMWGDGGQKKCTPLMAVMDDAEPIADQLHAWLKSQEYGEQPDHDGSNNKGWRITNSGPKLSEKSTEYCKWNECDNSAYDVLCVRPHWIEYHK